MQTASLAEWLDLPETKALLVYLRFRKAVTTTAFLAGQPVDQMAQGRAVAFNEIGKLLTGPTDKIVEAFVTAAKELNK